MMARCFANGWLRVGGDAAGGCGGLVGMVS